ncbi:MULTISPECIES: energy transducer TonB [unclassified Sinorhizobium]|uniref:energy transducer TonB family protein n=1 Tax=unclassified Sinorhizobium TaxID=2613772 RepID=UPI0024C395E7|nr:MULTISPECIES: energy transducer TonB [unclassified Sinorhizobium]MDK1374810.1 energy transducer TonB [Sinorhizobium sp. 6-70]MDK1478994.1 energy transducer TonB [Sinorhizobium sp. 6-117]
MKHIMKWAVAIGLSVLAHAGGAMLLEPSKDDFLMAGGAATEVTLLGNAFEEALQAGEPLDAVEPIEDALEEVKPSEISPTEELPEEVPPTTPESVSEQPSDIPPAEADVILPADEMPTTQAADAPVTASVAPVETVVPEEKPEPEKVEKKVEPKKAPPKKKKVARKKAGERGEQANTQAKGQADGVENATASAATGARQGSVAQEAGNAAVDNYKGKVQRKLNRAIRYPAEAKRQGLRGVAHVRFTVTSDGGLAGVSLARSAGSPILDQAALDTVRRAAPFPAIPAEARRDSWQFTIPVQFKR